MNTSWGDSHAAGRTSAHGRVDLAATGAPSNLLDRLEADERLLWWGRPDARRFAANYVVQLLVAVLFAGIGFWVTINALLRNQVFGTADPLSSYLGFGAFLAAGIGGLIGTYLMLRTISSRHDVAYGLTDRRLIIATGRWKAKSFGAKAFHKVKRTGKQRGTIWFDYGSSGDGDAYRHALFGIPDAERVEQLLRQQFPVQERKKSIWRPFG